MVILKLLENSFILRLRKAMRGFKAHSKLHLGATITNLILTVI